MTVPPFPPAPILTVASEATAIARELLDVLQRESAALAAMRLQAPTGFAEIKNRLVVAYRYKLEELQEEMPDAVAPMDKHGAEVLVTFHPRDIKFYPQNLYGYLKLYNAAGLDFTLTGSRGWDSTNIGLFAGDDPAAAELAGRVVAAGENLGVRTVLTAE